MTILVQLFGFSANILRYLAIIVIGFFGCVFLFPFLSNKFAMLADFFADYGTQLQLRTRHKKSEKQIDTQSVRSRIYPIPIYHFNHDFV